MRSFLFPSVIFDYYCQRNKKQQSIRLGTILIKNLIFKILTSSPAYMKDIRISSYGISVRLNLIRLRNIKIEAL